MNAGEDASRKGANGEPLEQKKLRGNLFKNETKRLFSPAFRHLVSARAVVKTADAYINDDTSDSRWRLDTTSKDNSASS